MRLYFYIVSSPRNPPLRVTLIFPSGCTTIHSTNRLIVTSSQVKNDLSSVLERYPRILSSHIDDSAINVGDPTEVAKKVKKKKNAHI